jgi:hypothetical protein
MRQKIELLDRINRAINTVEFERSLEEDGIDLFEFQCRWFSESKGDFNKLSFPFQKAILAGEDELQNENTGEISLSADSRR